MSQNTSSNVIWAKFVTYLYFYFPVYNILCQELINDKSFGSFKTIWMKNLGEILFCLAQRIFLLIILIRDSVGATRHLCFFLYIFFQSKWRLYKVCNVIAINKWISFYFWIYFKIKVLLYSSSILKFLISLWHPVRVFVKH